MTGFTDYSAKNSLNYYTGQIPAVTLPSVWLALFTVVGTDAGTGFTEVSGGAYARVQVAGSVAATAAFTTASPNITMTTNPGWVVPGMTVYDTTNSQAIGTVLTYSGTALVLTANAAHASSGSTDSLTFSAFSNATGSAPSSITTGAAITFAQATASWGTVIAFGLYDAVTSGNLLTWDYIGNFSWIPFTATQASPSVFTAHGNGYSAADSVVVTAEYGGTLPTGGGVFTGILTVASPSGDTFNVGQNATTAAGNGMIRKVIQQSIPINVTASFSSGNLTITGA